MKFKHLSIIITLLNTTAITEVKDNVLDMVSLKKFQETSKNFIAKFNAVSMTCGTQASVLGN